MLVLLVIVVIAVCASATPGCVEKRPIYIHSDSAAVRHEITKVLNVWADDACVSLTSDTANNQAISVRHVFGNRDVMECHPYERLFFSSTRASSAVNVTSGLRCLFDVPYANNASHLQSLLRISAFLHAAAPVSVWNSGFRSNFYQVIKHNVSLYTRLNSCDHEWLDTPAIPDEMLAGKHTPSVSSNSRALALIMPHDNAVWFGAGRLAPFAKHSLSFTPRAVALHKQTGILYIDHDSNLYSAFTSSVNQTTLVRKLHFVVKTIFSTINGSAFLVTNKAIYQLKLYSLSNVTLEPTTSHVCLLKYFNPAADDFLADFVPVVIAEKSPGYRIMGEFLSRVQPEFFVYCVALMLLASFVALPILGLLSYSAYELYKVMSRR